MLNSRTSLGIAIVLSCVVGCKSNDSGIKDSAGGNVGSATPDTTTLKPDSTARMTPPAAVILTDANVLAVASVGDSAEVALAKYMAANTTNADVKAYALLLANDHKKGGVQVAATAKRTGITMALPAADTTSQAASHALERLQSLSGTDRDTAFVNQAILDHQHDIDATKQMAASAQSAEVKTLLNNELPELQKHLDRAQKLSTKLAGGSK
ncbi:MAG: DUF4142 domain-containing protein [bacterium]